MPQSFDFIVLAPARSASTSFRRALNARSDIVCHGELFGRNNVHGFQSSRLAGTKPDVALRRQDIDAFWTAITAAPGRLVGCKLLLNHWFDEQNADYIERIIACKPKVIFLWRQDLVKRYFSMYKRRLATRSRKALEQVPPNLEDVVKDCELQIQMMRNASLLLRDRLPDGAFHIVNLEEMTNDFSGVVSRSIRFLGASTADAITKFHINNTSEVSPENEIMVREFYEECREKLSYYCEVPIPLAN